MSATHPTDASALRLADGIRAHELPGAPILSERRPDPCAVVIFGATGDLTARKLVPALYNLHVAGRLPEPFALVAHGRRPLQSEALRARLRQATAEFSRTPLDEGAWDRFAAAIEYVAGEVDDAAAYRRLGRQLAAIDRDRGTRGNRIYYLATPPGAFPVILQHLRECGLLHPPDGEAGRPWSRVVIEKPFGRDLESARALNRLVAESLDERQTFRIDHYLGKETVQNILVFRFGNSIFEPLWNRKYIDHVQITAAETIGVEGRGRFYDATGVVRDIVQNHLLQVLALCAMEPPVSFAADDVRDQKVQVLRALRRLAGDDLGRQVVLAQYEGYRREDGVAGDSRTPTYTALKVLIDNWRWQGVPFYLRAGKRLAQRVTEVAVQFQPIPLCLFQREDACQIIEPSILTLRIQPAEGISLRFAVKVPGDDLSVGNVLMNMTYAKAFGRPLSEAYERLLLDCMRGDATLFTRRDGVEEAWAFVTPVLDAWDSGALPVARYDAASQGPVEAGALLSRDGRRWRPLEPAAEAGAPV